MTSGPDRQRIIALITEAKAAGARLDRACAEVGISTRTFQRWTDANTSTEDGRPGAKRPRPANKLSDEEKAVILETVNLPEFRSLPPGQIVPKLADRGIYLASERTIYRIMAEAKQQNHRGNRHKPSKREPVTHEATAPNEVWMWDITWLKGPVCGLFFYLYLIQDLFSRKIVGWEVYEQERAVHAQELIGKTVLRERVVGKHLVLHADNGSPMRAATFVETLRRLDIEPSHSRPRVSNDNAFVERLFGTMKYCPAYPENGFADLQAAQDWVMTFVRWYNEEHQHRGIAYVTPNQRHNGEDEAILAQRRGVYAEARSAHPERWTGETRTWRAPPAVTLNPTRADDLSTVESAA